MKTISEEIREKLFELQDLKYRDFNAALIPNIDKERVIGVRSPELKKLAAGYKNTDVSSFLAELPHKYVEENYVHAQLIAGIKDFDKCIAEVDRFLPFVDNWSTCDALIPKVFAKNKEKLLVKIKEWHKSGHTYKVRFGTGCLMRWYLGDDFDIKYAEMAAAIRSDEYYINMMTAWYFATALAKNYDDVLPFIEQHRLDEWTHNKAIQKAVESFRVSDEHKAYLKTLKR